MWLCNTSTSISDELMDAKPQLRRILDTRLVAVGTLFKQRTTAADKPLGVAKAALNEMRGMAAGPQPAFLTRAAYIAKHEGLVSQPGSLSDRVTAIVARDSGSSKTLHGAATIVSFLVALAAAMVATRHVS